METIIWILLLVLQILIIIFVFSLLAKVSKLLERVNKLFEPGYVITVGKLEKVKEDYVRVRGEVDSSYKIKGEPPPPPNGTPPPTG
ncbi:MAG: hypothetical protein ACFFDN_37845 [Candidatus Hodarchaeota archaeon]